MRTDNQKRRNGIIAAALGAALLMGGSTYALWSDSALLGGGTIQAGNLDIVAGGDAMRAYDVSEDIDGLEAVPLDDVNDFDFDGLAITAPANYRIVPGDTVALIFNYKVTLIGDNLKANLSLNVTDLMDTAADNQFDQNAAATKGITFKYAVYDNVGEPVTAKAPLSSDTESLGTLSSTMTAEDVYFVLFVTFNSVDGDQGQTNTEKLLTLSNAVSMTLTQVRPS